MSEDGVLLSPYRSIHAGPFMYKKIVLGVSGGIAAYKSAELVRLLRGMGCEVRVVMTACATQFVTPLTFQALSGQAVTVSQTNHFSTDAMDHIALARWADSVLIVPATANILAKIAYGLADDVLTTLCVANERPLLLAPAMNRAMWHHVTTQENLARLVQRGVFIIEPIAGLQACGEEGLGCLPDPAAIVASLKNFSDQRTSLKGIRFLITAGPTQEPIDPIRYLSNRSSGKMGYALAHAVLERGGEVTLVSGPTQLNPPVRAKHLSVRTAHHMHEKVMEEVSQCHIFISTAAVADYTPEEVGLQKLKKGNHALSIRLKPTVDILKAVTHLRNPPFTVGFAAETERLEEYARKKWAEKKLDMLAANDVSSEEVGCEVDENALWVIWKEGECLLPRQSKLSLAHALLTQIQRCWEMAKVFRE